MQYSCVAAHIEGVPEIMFRFHIEIKGLRVEPWEKDSPSPKSLFLSFVVKSVFAKGHLISEQICEDIDFQK